MSAIDSGKKNRMEDSMPPARPNKRQLPRILESLGTIQDLRQAAKVRYPIGDVLLLTVAAVTCGARTWVDIERFGTKHARHLRRFLHIEAIPSHDTIERVLALVSPDVLLRVYLTWCDVMDFEAETPASLKGLKLLNIDGKTMRGSGGRGKKQIHIESAWDPQRAVCLGQMAVKEKSNEIDAIPQVLASIDLHGYIVTSDAMGTHVKIAAQIVDQGGHYLLALKGNQGTMLEDVELAAGDPDFLKDLKKRGLYKKTREKAHGQIETREYWQEDRIDWLARRDEWPGLRTVGFEKTTIKRTDPDKGEVVTTSWRCFLSSLAPDIDMFATAVRGHWRIEAMHNVLDVTLGEDANQTIERTAAENLATLHKWTYSILRHVDVGWKASMRSKTYDLAMDPVPALRMLAAAI